MFAFLRLARPADWIKNVFVLPALLASHRADDPSGLWAAGIAFIAFSLTASGVYCINDAFDWQSDARHPTKRTRPIPSGQISPRAAFVAGIIWIAAGLFISRLTGAWVTAGVLGIYLLLQATYNVILKRIAMIDAVAVSIGFVLRALAGATAIDEPASIWMLSCVFFLCLFLAGIKRMCDLSTSGAIKGSDESPAESESPKQRWQPPTGRGNADELSWLLAVSAAVSILTFLGYAMSDHAERLIGSACRGFSLLTPLVVIAMFRFYRGSRSGRYRSPLDIGFRDPIVLIASVLFVVLSVILLYVPAACEFLEAAFGELL
jgi:decaprenyl-phosphate phosphoribosyltransferase